MFKVVLSVVTPDPSRKASRQQRTASQLPGNYEHRATDGGAHCKIK